MGWTAVGTIAISSGGGGGGGGVSRNGQDGATWLLSNSPPTADQGKVGDLCFQSAPPGSTGPIILKGDKGDPGPISLVPGPPGKNIGSDGGLWVPPTPALFTATLSNSASFSTLAGYPSIYAPATNADVYSYALKAIPSSTPYKCQFYLKPWQPQSNFSSYGVMWMDGSVHLKAIGCVFSGQNLIEVGFATDGIAHIATDNFTGPSATPINWFQLRDDGTNQYYDYSIDGINWRNAYSEVRNTNVTPTKIGFYVNVRNAISAPANLTLFSYQEIASGSL